MQRTEDDMKIDDVEEPPMDDEDEPIEQPKKTVEPEPVAAATPPQPTNKPAIDSKPTVRVRAPPGGKSSIFF